MKRSRQWTKGKVPSVTYLLLHVSLFSRPTSNRKHTQYTRASPALRRLSRQTRLRCACTTIRVPNNLTAWNLSGSSHTHTNQRQEKKDKIYLPAIVKPKCIFHFVSCKTKHKNHFQQFGHVRINQSRHCHVVVALWSSSDSPSLLRFVSKIIQCIERYSQQSLDKINQVRTEISTDWKANADDAGTFRVLHGYQLNKSRAGDLL